MILPKETIERISDTNPRRMISQMESQWILETIHKYEMMSTKGGYLCRAYKAEIAVTNRNENDCPR